MAKRTLYIFVCLAMLIGFSSCKDSFTEVGKSQIDSLFYRLKIADTLQRGLDTNYLKRQINQASLNIQNFQIYFQDTLNVNQAEFLLSYYKNLNRMNSVIGLNKQQLQSLKTAQNQLAALKADLISKAVQPADFMKMFAKESARCSVLYANAFYCRKEVQVSVNSQVGLTSQLQQMMDKSKGIEK